MIDIVAYIATAVCLVAYAVSARTKQMKWFNLANASCWIPIGLSALRHRAIPSLIITVTFGVIGTWGVLRSTRPTGG